MRLLPGLDLELLPAQAYSVSESSATAHTLGIALDRQRGVHAIGTDRRSDFDTLPGTLAWTPPGIGLFSESPEGGEYLLLRWLDDETPPDRRIEWQGHRKAVALAHQLRRDMIAGADQLLLQERTLAFQSLIRSSPRGGTRKQAYATTLDLIEEELDQPLTLERMADLCAQTPLAFLRGFTAAFGQTPHAYVTARRVAAARRLLSETDLSLAMVAYDCGFSHQSHLGSALRAAIGLTPAAYRRAFAAQNKYMPPMKITPENKSAVTQ